MSIFGKIKDAIFGHKAKAAAPAAPTAPATQAAPATPRASGAASAQVQPAPASEVDVERNLSEMAEGKDLNWRSSIVDLMKLLGIDSSLDNRKELARELGYTGDLDGSAEMNIWLHAATMKELQRNGGRVPSTMLD